MLSEAPISSYVNSWPWPEGLLKDRWKVRLLGLVVPVHVQVKTQNVLQNVGLPL